MPTKVELIKAGDGLSYPKSENTVTVHYTAFLEDGTKFDSSRERVRYTSAMLSLLHVDTSVHQSCLPKQTAIMGAK